MMMSFLLKGNQAHPTIVQDNHIFELSFFVFVDELDHVTNSFLYLFEISFDSF
jgi:hypothetical protein